jgi:hypothetical protein
MLGRFVPAAVRRQPPMARNLTPFRVALLGILTAGVVPLLQLRSRIAAIATLQQQQLELASELAGCHLDPTDAAELQRAAKRVNFPKGFVILSGLLAIAALVAAIAYMGDHGWYVHNYKRLILEPPSGRSPVQIVWMGTLTAGYLLLYSQLLRHAAGLQQFALALTATTDGRLQPIPSPPPPLGLKPVHIGVALVMMYFGMLWALPMLLAWGAYTQFLGRADGPFRDALSDRLEALSGVAPVIVPALRCPNPKCLASLPDEAQYCPRCGQSVLGAPSR